MPCHLSAYARERVVRLWQQGKTPVQMMGVLAKEDITTTRRTVTRRIFCWTKDAGLADQSRLGRSSVVMKKMVEFMKKRLEEDKELSANVNVNLIGLTLARAFRPSLTTEVRTFHHFDILAAITRYSNV